MNDLDLVRRAQEGDTRAADTLLRFYDRRITGAASEYFLPGGDREDVRQEARIGFLKAIRLYDPARGVPFDNYAVYSIRQHMIGAVIAANRLKQKPLNESVREIVVSDEAGPEPIVDMLHDRSSDPVDLLERREGLREVGRFLRVELSPLEAKVLLAQANGLNYEQIQACFGLPWRTVDRALTRARWKRDGVGPPSAQHLFGPRQRGRIYVCPTCGGETVKRKKGRGRPPRCNVCTFRAAA